MSKMHDELRISEFAKLMNVSTHQIRYFEEKEILMPMYVDDNGYRMYGVNEIYLLSQILMLRKMDVSVQDIKEILESSTQQSITNQLENSKEKIAATIDQLTILKSFIETLLHERDQITAAENTAMNVVHLSERKLKKYLQLTDGKKLTARDMYVRNKQDPLSIFEKELYYLENEAGTAVYYETTQEAEKLLSAGKYFIQRYDIAEEEDLDNAFKEMAKTLAKKYPKAAMNPIIAVEKSYLSIFNKDTILFELQVDLN